MGNFGIAMCNRNRVFALLLVVAAVAAVAWIGPADADVPLPTPDVTVSPPNPSALDVVHVRVDTHTYCFLGYPTDGITVNVNDNVVNILLKITCPQAIGIPPPPYWFAVDIGPLPNGAYQIRYTVMPGISGVYRAPQMLATVPLQVGPAANATDNAIPTLSAPALAALALVVGSLGVIAYRARYT